MLEIDKNMDMAEVRRQLNISANPNSTELRILKEKEIYHQRLIDLASQIDTAEFSDFNTSSEYETSNGKHSMEEKKFLLWAKT